MVWVRWLLWSILSGAGALSLALPAGAQTADAAAQPEALELPAYDYAATALMVYHGDAGPMLFFSPFSHPAPVSGGLLYEIVLLYVPQMEPIVLPPSNPVHTLDLLVEDRFGQMRIGKRLWAGEHWLADDERIAFMQARDYHRLQEIIMQRYTKPGEAMGAVELPFTAITEADLPEQWSPGAASVTRAIARYAPNDYRRDGYDPGVAIRAAGGERDDAQVSAPGAAAQPPVPEPEDDQASANARVSRAGARERTRVADAPPTAEVAPAASLAPPYAKASPSAKPGLGPAQSVPGLIALGVLLAVVAIVIGVGVFSRGPD